MQALDCVECYLCQNQEAHHLEGICEGDAVNWVKACRTGQLGDSACSMSRETAVACWCLPAADWQVIQADKYTAVANHQKLAGAAQLCITSNC
jgi:hypothetical protein